MNNSAAGAAAPPLQPAERKYRTTERKIQVGFAIALLCLSVVGVVSYLSVQRLNATAAWVEHTHAVIARLDALFATASDAQNAHRGYANTGNEPDLQPYLAARNVVPRESRRLHQMTTDHPAQQARVEQLTRLLDAHLKFSADVIDARRAGGFEAARALMLTGRGKQIHDRVRALVASMKAAEEQLLRARQLEARRRSYITEAVIVLSGMLAFGLVGWSLFAVRRDFSRRQQAEAQLERFFSLSLDFLSISSADGYFKRVSPAVTDVLGWSVEEFLSRPYMSLVHPDDHSATLQHVERQRVTGEKVPQFENRYRHKDGSYRVLSWRSIPQPDGLMYGTARDVTDMKRAEQALRDANDQLELRVRERTAELTQANASLQHSERRFRALIEHGSDAIALIDANNKVLYTSPAVTAIEGYAPEDLLQRTVFEHTHHPDDISILKDTVSRLLANPGLPIPVLWRRRHKNGRWLWLEGVAINLLNDPAVGAIVTNYRDVTERKQAEAKLQAQMARLALLNEITRAISERQDLSSIFQVVIRSLEEELPLDFGCMCLYDAGTSCLAVAHVGVRSESLTLDLALAERDCIELGGSALAHSVTGSLVYDPELAATAHPFHERLLQAGLHALVAAPLVVEDHVFGVLICARRVAHSFSSGECEFLRQLCDHVALAARQAQLYASLHTAYEDLRHTQQAVMQQERLRVLGQMASGIAHDINNAISPIALYTESLLENEPGLSERTRSYLQTIQRAIADVAETVARMREFYRQRENTGSLAPVQLNTLVTQVVELTRARWFDMPQQTGNVIQLRTELAPEVPPIMGTESELREALTNLIFNAVDAMPQGGTLTLRTSVVEDLHAAPEPAFASTARQVQLEVIDTGIGMDEKTRRHCLELFFTTKGERGTGLGLAMVYGTVERHGAEIKIDSALGEGTKVRLSFPAPRASIPAPRPAAPRVYAGLRVLIVDDDPILLKSLRDTLEGDGYAIVTANGGQEGIDTFTAAHRETSPFDAVITDLGMPAIDGRKVATAVKTVSHATPVIMLTGWGQRLATEGDLPAHVDRVLSKPPRLRELRDALAEVTAKV